VVIVIAKTLAGGLEGGGDPGEALSKALPIAGTVAVVFGGRRGAIDGLDANGFNDAQGSVGIFELSITHMGGRHGQTGVLEACCQGGGIGKLAAPTFDLGIAKPGKGLERFVQRRFIARAVKLIGKVHHRPLWYVACDCIGRCQITRPGDAFASQRQVDCRKSKPPVVRRTKRRQSRRRLKM
jgi:hypothetical protein